MGGVGDGGGGDGDGDRDRDRSLLGELEDDCIGLGEEEEGVPLWVFGFISLVRAGVEMNQRCIRVYKGCVLWSRHICLYSKLRPPRLLLWQEISSTVFIWHQELSHWICVDTEDL